jgi:hypothetical protein
MSQKVGIFWMPLAADFFDRAAAPFTIAGPAAATPIVAADTFRNFLRETEFIKTS